MAVQYEGSLEYELESEFEAEGEQHEGIFGTVARGLGSLLGEGEFESHHEFESEFEGHHETHEGSHEFEGLHELEGEFEGLHELEGIHELESEFEGHHELEGEFEGHHEIHEGEQFFGRLKKLARGAVRFVGRNAGVFKKLARFAAPMIGTAIGGPFGTVLGKLAAQALRETEAGMHEGEMEMEMEGELEGLHELNESGHHEIAHMLHEMPHHEAVAEMMASAATRTDSEAEAEAMIGAASVSVLSTADRAALARFLPQITRGVALLTRILRARRRTRSLVRTIPGTVVKGAARIIRSQAAAGRPITAKTVARAMTASVKNTLGSPRRCAVALRRNIVGTAKAARPGTGRPRVAA